MSLKEMEVATLSPRQENAVRLLLKGYSDARVGRELGVARETVNRWRHHDPGFQAALEAQKDHFRLMEPEDAMKQRIDAVLVTKLLSLEGIKARLELKDHLILQDLLDFNEKRTRLIQRLEVDIDQSRFYIGSLSKDESLAQQVALLTNDYKRSLLETLMAILDKVIESSETREEILTKLGECMEE